MNLTVKIKKANDNTKLSEKSYYNLEIKTYKNTFEGKFERSELRYLIQEIDNGI